MNLYKELAWRGMIQDSVAGVEEMLEKEKTTAYIGFDPTSDSLHLGSFQQIALLMHVQRSGNRPIALIGGATGMIGDPTGKSAERELLSMDELNHNINGLKNQLSKFIDFDKGSNGAVLVNNYDWFKDFSFLDFIRDVGKHMSVNYMMAKDSVQNRLETGLSFTEFSYQLVQGYDFLHLYRNFDCKLQMGGSDQWGNIVAGTELIRRIDGGKAYAFTSPLILRADGTKFGKSAAGENVWLDPKKTSPFKFYQYLLNRADDEAMTLLKRFTYNDEAFIQDLHLRHTAEPHLRLAQQELAKDLTIKVHSEDDYLKAVESSKVLFGASSIEQMKSLSESDLLEIFEGIPQHYCSRSIVESGCEIVTFLTQESKIITSNNEARRGLTENSFSINKQKIDTAKIISKDDLLNDKYILVQKGKKNYYLVIVA